MSVTAGSAAFAAPIPQPVARTQKVQPTAASPEEDTGWWKTLAALRLAFPVLGPKFLMWFVPLILTLFPDVADAELAEAVGYAWRHADGRQKSAGLFEHSVPDALRALRKHKTRVAATAIPQPVARGPSPHEDESSGSPWMRVRLRIRGQIGERAYDDWVSLTAFESFELSSGEMRVRVPDEVTKEWLEQEYGDLLLGCARAEGLAVRKFTYQIGVAP